MDSAVEAGSWGKAGIPPAPSSPVLPLHLATWRKAASHPFHQLDGNRPTPPHLSSSVFPKHGGSAQPGGSPAFPACP